MGSGEMGSAFRVVTPKPLPTQRPSNNSVNVPDDVPSDLVTGESRLLLAARLATRVMSMPRYQFPVNPSSQRSLRS